MMRLTETVKHLIIINVIIYFGYNILAPQFGSAMPDFRIYYPTCDSFRPYQMVTHMFMHDPRGISHLLFNMLMLFFMGPIVEQRIGNKKFLILYLASGILASVFVWFMNTIGIDAQFLCRGALGASGAVFGVIAAFGILFPNMQVMLLIPPIPIKGRYLAVGLLVLGFLMDFNGNTGHLAHLGGALVGAGLIYYWKNKFLL